MYQFHRPELHKRNVHFNNMHEMQSLVPLFNESNQRKFVAASINCIKNRGNVKRYDNNHIGVEDFCDIFTKYGCKIFLFLH